MLSKQTDTPTPTGSNIYKGPLRASFGTRGLLRNTERKAGPAGASDSRFKEATNEHYSLSYTGVSKKHLEKTIQCFMLVPGLSGPVGAGARQAGHEGRKSS